MNKLTDEVIEAARERMRTEKEKPTPNQLYNEVNMDCIRHFCHAIGDFNPLWMDEEYAKKSVWGGVIAPPTLGRFVAIGPVFPLVRDPFLKNKDSYRSKGEGLPGLGGLSICEQFWNYEPIRLNDRILTTQRRNAGVVDSRARVPGDCSIPDAAVDEALKAGAQECAYDGIRLADQVHEYKLYREPKRELLSREVHHLLRFETPLDPKKGKYKNEPLPRYTQGELDRMNKMYENEFMRGSDTLYWEDVSIGDELPSICHGPLTVTSIVPLVAGTLFCFAPKTASIFSKRFPGAGVVNEETNTIELVEAQHWDRYAAGRLGFPRGYDTGLARLFFFGRLLTNWMGDNAQLRYEESFVTRPLFLYDTLFMHGKVKAKDETASSVQIDLWSENQRGEPTGYGHATVELRRRGGS